MSLSLLDKKVKEAKALIAEALSKHGNGLYVGFSGGKDSRALLKMAREIEPNILAVHNAHKGEDIGSEKGVLVIRSPKKIMVPRFLKTVKLCAQLDGTRRDEDDFVMINGKDIHRSKMRYDKTHKGVWGLKVYFPLINFTEEEVYAYIRRK